MANKKKMADRMAPGHAYIQTLGTGIQWTENKVHLWEGGRMIETASHKTNSAYEYFHNLGFVESFPSVTHWWFRSAWTQKVRLSGVQSLIDTETVWGHLQFIDESVPAQFWTARFVDGERTDIFVPFPPNEVQPVNIPLRFALARLVAGVIADEVPRDKWMVVTSLVHKDELEKVFPIADNELRWHLEGVHSSLRRELCLLQGMKEQG
jgi:hypothetical protein